MSAALEPGGPNEALGLDAFATETPPAKRAATAPASLSKERVALVALAVLVVLEAIPAVLWLQNRLAPTQPVTTVAAAPITPVPLPAEAVASAPCTPTAAAPAATTAAATTGSSDVVRAATPPAPPRGLMAGLVSITAPVPMHVYADGRLVGTTEAETIMLPVGEHDVELVSDAVGFRARRSVVVEAGRTANLRIDPPRVPVHINAIPWAEVWVDNQRVGETPIGNLQQTIGSHEVVFRHPELGERRMVVVVTMKEPARISMDLRKR